MNKRIIYMLFLAAFTLITCTGGPDNKAGRIFYVDDETGRDLNPGTEDKPFKTIGKAAGKARAGDTVLVNQGVYNEAVEISVSGKPDSWITYMANPGHRVRVLVDGNSKGGDYSRAFQILGNYIHVEGFEITATSEKGKGIHVKGNQYYPAHLVRIYNNTVYDC